MGDWLSYIPTLLALLVLLGFSAFFSGSETALFSLSRAFARRMERGTAAQRAASRLLRHPQRLLSTLLVGNMFVNILLTSLTASLVARLVGANQGLASAVTIVVVWPLVMIFGELTPKTLAYRHGRSVAQFAALPLTAVAWVTAPVRWLLRVAAQAVLRVCGQSQPARWDTVTPEEVTAMVTLAEKTGAAARHESELVEHILRLGMIQANEIMIPRTAVVGIRDDATLEDAYSKARECRHSRLPIYHDDLDDIWGILSMVDLPRWRGTPWMHTPLADFRARLASELPDDDPTAELPFYPVLLVPETVKVDSLLTQMRESRAQFAVLVGEYGGTAGILTLNDILEEVVGQIAPSDRGGGFALVETDGGFLADGGVHIRDLADATGIALEPNGSDTLGGLVMERLGRLPRSGDEVQEAGWRFEVVRMAGRRVGTVKLMPVVAEAALEEEDDG